MDWAALQVNRNLGEPLYLQLCTILTECIAAGSLQPGDQLLSERKLAELLSVSRTTAVNAYHELESRGLLRSYMGRGTFVSGRPERLGAHFAWRGKVSPMVQRHLDSSIRTLVGSTRRDEIAFGPSRPAFEYFPRESYASLSQQLLRTRPGEALGLLPTEGHPYLREIIAKREGVRPEEVLIVSGAQQALDLIGRCLLCPQDVVVMDWPGFLGAIQTFRLAGAVLAGWDVVTADLDELEDIFLKRRPKLLYLNPTFQNPTGRVLPVDIRRGIVELACNYHVPIVEDEAYRDLYFTELPPPTLLALEGNGLVVHLRTFSKTFAPGLRLGYVIADESIIDQLALVKAQSDLFCPGLSQLVMAEMLSRGVLDSYSQLLRKKHQERAVVMEKSLREEFPAGTLTWQTPRGGLFIWAHLRTGDSRSLAREALKYGVNFAPGDIFFPDGSGKRTLRLCYSGTEPQRIPEGVKRLAGAFCQSAMSM